MKLWEPLPRIPLGGESPCPIRRSCWFILALEPWVCFPELRHCLSARGPAPCPGGKNICIVDVDHGCRRGVPSSREASTKQRRGGIITFYLIGTAWVTARRREGETSRMDWIVLSIPLVLSILSGMNGIKVVRGGASSQDGVPVGMTFFMGSICLLAALGDIRMLLGDGVVGATRRAANVAGVFRAVHRGRIIFSGTIKPSTAIAYGVGLGRHLSPDLFSTGLYLVLTITPLVLQVFWLARVRFTSAYKGNSMPAGGDVYSLRA